MARQQALHAPREDGISARHLGARGHALVPGVVASTLLLPMGNGGVLTAVP